MEENKVLPQDVPDNIPGPFDNEAQEFVEAIKKDVPEDQQNEIAEKIQAISTSKRIPEKKLRGVGITRKNKSKSKKAMKIEKNSRRRNRSK